MFMMPRKNEAFECADMCGYGQGFLEVGVAPMLDVGEHPIVAARVAVEVGDVMEGLDMGPGPCVASDGLASSS